MYKIYGMGAFEKGEVKGKAAIPPPTKNAPLSTKTKVRFLNDVCLRQMMLAPPMMTASPNDVCLTAHWANIASLRPTGATSF